MIFIKEIENICYSDVILFCDQQHRENLNLDYKREIDTSLVKTIAAMANTWGGLIIVGVEDEDSRPKFPVVGIPYEEHIREKINNLVLGNITPPIFLEIQVCQSDDYQKALVVIRVPQSHMSPHAIKKNTKVYIRTDTSNEPEELATVDRILWLIDRRKKSSELKNAFYQKAEERFHLLCQKTGSIIEHVDVTMSISPIYPFELLIGYRSLRQDIPRKIQVNGWGIDFSIRYSEFIPTHEGTYTFFYNKGSGYILYEEMNQYGLFYHREDLGYSKKNEEGHIINFSYLYEILRRIDLFLESMAIYYKELGYWGLIELRISLKKIKDVNFNDLPAPRGYSKFDNISKSPLDETIEFVKTISYRELKDERVSLTVGMMEEIGWALGFPDIRPDDVLKLMKEQNRAT